MKRAEEGLALIFVTWTLVLLMVVAFGAAFEVKTFFNAETAYYGRLRAQWLAHAGIERGAAIIEADAKDVDSTGETWWNADGEEFALSQLGEGGYALIRDDFSDDGEPHFGIEDESGKLNLNSASYEMLLALPGMTEEIADSIIDWRDTDEDPRPNGAETEYYEALDQPYKAKNAPFETLRELLLVKGATVSTFFGEDANGNGILDENENDGGNSAPDDNADGALDRGLISYLTVSSFESNVDAQGSKRININSASEGDLKKAGFEDGEAKDIVAGRKSKKFETIFDLLDVTKQVVTPQDVQRGGSSSGGGASIGTGSSSGGGSAEKSITEARLKEVADKLTLSDEATLPGRVNVNTAPRAVLNAIFADENAAQGIEEYARSSDGPFKNVAELLSVESVSADLMKKVANYLTVRSNAFHVRSVGYLGNQEAKATVEALLVRDGDTVSVRYERVID